MLKIVLTFVIICGVFMMPMVAQGFNLVDEGKAGADIVLPEKPNNVEKYAAKELQRHIAKATKCKLEIVSEDNITRPCNIYIGNTKAAKKNHIDTKNLPNNAYRIKITDKAIIFAGKDGKGKLPQDDKTPMGTLFAVYKYLNDNIGVRWMWPGDAGTFVPPAATLSSGKKSEITHIPQLIHSRMRDATRLGPWKGVYSEDEFKKALLERQIWLRRHQFARGTSFEYGHAFGKYWTRFGKQHPEFFAMGPDGKRAPHDKRIHLVQMCVSNPELHKQVIRDWVEGKQSYKGEFINGCENDSRAVDNSCLCKECQAWDPAGTVYFDSSKASENSGNLNSARPNNLSDRYAKFWLALQKEGEKYNSKATVIGYAYSNYSTPPKETKLNKRIIVGLVQNFNYPLDSANRNRFIQQWNGWSNTGARLYLRPNYFLAGYSLPYIFARQFGDDYKFACEHGMIATDFDSLTGMFGTQGPNLYMAARLNDNPEMTVDEVLDEYYSTFGKAAPVIKEYFELWEKLTSKRDSEFKKKYPQGGWNSVGWSGHKLYSPADIARAGKMLHEAQKLAGQDQDLSARINFLQKGLKHTALTIKTMNAFEAYKSDRRNTKLKSEFNNALKELDKYRQEIRNDQVVNIPILLKLETWMGWRRNIGK